VCIIRRAAPRRLDAPSRAGDVNDRTRVTSPRARGLFLHTRSSVGSGQGKTLQELVAAETERGPSCEDVADTDDDEEEEDEEDEDGYITVDGHGTIGYDDSRAPLWSAAPVPLANAQAEGEGPYSYEDYRAGSERDRVTSASRHLPLFMQEWLVRQTVPRESASQDAIERSEGWVRSAAQASSIFSAVLTPEDEQS